MRVFARTIFLVAVFVHGGLNVSCHAAIPISTASDFLQQEQYASKKISMDFKGASLNDVLKIFSQQSGLNFIAGSDVAEIKLNLYLDEVPVDLALERILSANGLTYEMQAESNIFVVKKVERPEKDLMTRVYSLKHATVSISKIFSTFSSADSQSSEGGSSSAATATTASSGIVAAVKAVLSSSGALVEDSRTNSLIVTDIPAQFPLIEQTISRLDVRIPQILIEVEMLDISKNTADLLGARFGDTLYNYTPASVPAMFPFNMDNLIDDGKIGGTGEDGSSDLTFTQGTMDFSGFTMTLQFLKTQSDTKSLARPRIMTLNNETAIINIKTDEAIGEKTTDSAETGSQIGGEAERVETGVFLTVTPQANIDTGEIVMAVAPKVIEARTGKVADSKGQLFRDPEERGSKSMLRVKDGETIIIGGLLRNDESKTITRLPWISNIPFIGAAFRHKDNKENQRELIIFLTPHIIKEGLAANVAAANYKNIVREQTNPQSRVRTIQDELSAFETQR